MFFVIFDIIFGFLTFFCVDCINFRLKILILDDVEAVSYFNFLFAVFILGWGDICFVGFGGLGAPKQEA